MEILNAFEKLSMGEIDKAVGFKLERLTGNNDFSLLIAEIEAGRTMKPHFHKKGIEIYLIYEGSGKIRIGKFSKSKLIWDNEFPLNKGDCFTVSENKVHQLVNNSSANMTVIFISPMSHLNKDRFFINQKKFPLRQPHTGIRLQVMMKRGV